MAPPVVSIYVTSLTSQPKVRQNIELLRRSLRALEIPYTEHDLVMDQDAKSRWQRAKPAGQVIGLPGYLVGNEWVGTMDDFEYASETGSLPEFLHQNKDIEGNMSIGEAELEKLMREMSDTDLDALAAEVGKSDEPTNKDDASKSPLSGLKSSGKSEDAINKQVQDNITKISAGLGRAGGGGSGEGSSTSTSTSAQQTLDSITQKASELIESLGGPEPHTGTIDDPTSPKSSSFPSEFTMGKSKSPVAKPKAESPITAPATSASPIGSGGGNDSNPPTAPKSRRLSKQEIAEEMMKADSVEGLMASLGMAEGAEKNSKAKAD